MAKMPRSRTPAEPEPDADDLGNIATDGPTEKANRAAARSASPRSARAPGATAEHMFAHGRPRTDG